MAEEFANWKKATVWGPSVACVLSYLNKPNLKFGKEKLNKARPFVDYFCEQGSVTRDEMKKHFQLENDDDVHTILSNVTMAIQGSGGGDVWPPELGGWYQVEVSGDIQSYVVCPGFASAWKMMCAPA